MAGRLNRTSARELPEPDLEVTFRSESVPKLLPPALWSTQLSRSAATVAVVQAATTVQARAAGDWSTLPAGSIARTRTSWLPTVNPVYWCGEAQPLHAPPSREHWNDEPASLDENVNDGLRSVVDPLGPVSRVVSGASKSGAPNVSTSCGRSLPCSRLLNCCSASWFSFASRIRNP